MSQDITKLPKWAQLRISVAENSVEYWKTKILMAESGHTEVFVQDHQDGDRGLPPGSRISFKIIDDDGEEAGRYDVSMTDEGTIEVRGVGRNQLRTIHRSSNVFEVELVPYSDTNIGGR